MPAKCRDRRLPPTAMIAPCGMNCSLCSAFLRDKNRCPGCRGDDRGKCKTRLVCKIKMCETRRGKFCSSKCESFPCQWLNHLDKRYRAKYGMSMVENLRSIETGGLRSFLEAEKTKWTCPGCGAKICVHYPSCRSCGRKWHCAHHPQA